jgi:hypothetical protein
MPYTRDGDTITLTLTPDQHGQLIMALGLATGSLLRDGCDLHPWFVLANAINEGNPAWRPYVLSSPG